MRARRRLLTAVSFVLLPFLGCGTPGAPQPPSLRLPRPVDDLSASRKGERVVLSWTPSHMTTDRQNIRRAGDTAVCRAVNVFPMASCAQEVGRATTQMARWTKSKEAPPAHYTDSLPLSLSQQNPLGFATYALEDFNPRGAGAGLSNQVQVPLAPTLPPPDDLRTQATANGIVLSWTGVLHEHEAPELRHIYRLYRRSASVEKKPEVVLGEIALQTDPHASFVDHSFEWEQTYQYWIAVVTQVALSGKPPIEVEGENSPEITVVAHDVFPPATPAGLQAVYSGVGQQLFIDLTWAPDLEPDLAGYNVYRREAGAEWTKINSEAVKTPSFRDRNVQPGHTYFYSVSAIDERGNESARSEEASETIPRD